MKLRIITDNEKAYDAGSDVTRFQDAKIPLRVDDTPFHMHHKFAVFDREILLTGSYNWTRSAARYNEENLIVTEDPRLVADVASWRGREVHALAGIGAVGAFVVGIAVLGEQVTPLRILAAVLIVSGLVLMKLTSADA